MSIRATLELHGKTATGFSVPEDIVLSFGVGKRPPVKVTINGYTYRSTIAPMGGEYMIPVAAEVRERAGIAAGEEIEVDLQLDTEKREVVVPEDFAQAMAAAPEAKSFFEGLSYSNKRQFVLSVEGAKTAETRQRRIEKSILMLSERRIS